MALGTRLTLVLAMLLAGSACDAAAAANLPDLDLYARLLERHTRAVDDTVGTRVDYAALRGDPDWAQLVAGLAASPEPATSAERLAYWINAYNILVIDLVARNYPLESIRDLGSLLRPVWKLDAGRAAGRVVTLDEVEHAILRPLGEPRFHMAIVCASTSCPSLAREPFRAERLDAQLDAAARAFVARSDKGLRVEARRLRISKIFRWFDSDFDASGGVLAFVRRHATPEVRAAIDGLGPEPSLVYFDYDWSLNGIGRPAQ